jgi:hypothetical protein
MASQSSVSEQVVYNGGAYTTMALQAPPAIKMARTEVTHRSQISAKLVGMADNSKAISKYTNSNVEDNGVIIVNFPSMPDVVELARQANYTVTPIYMLPDGIHLYTSTSVLEIPLSFMLHYSDEEFCPQGSQTLLAVAARMESLVLPLNSGENRTVGVNLVGSGGLDQQNNVTPYITVYRRGTPAGSTPPPGQSAESRRVFSAPVDDVSSYFGQSPTSPSSLSSSSSWIGRIFNQLSSFADTYADQERQIRLVEGNTVAQTFGGTPVPLTGFSPETKPSKSTSPSNLAMQTGKDAFAWPQPCLLDLISDGQSLGIYCVGYVKNVRVRLKGPWMVSSHTGSKNLPSELEADFTFVHNPSYTNMLAVAKDGENVVGLTLPGQVNAYAEDVRTSLFNTVGLSEQYPNDYRGPKPR